VIDRRIFVASNTWVTVTVESSYWTTCRCEFPDQC